MGSRTIREIEKALPDKGYDRRKAARFIYEECAKEQINSLEHRLRTGRHDILTNLNFIDVYVSASDPEYDEIYALLRDFNLFLMARMHTFENLSPRYAYVFDAITDRYVVYHTLED